MEDCFIILLTKPTPTNLSHEADKWLSGYFPERSRAGMVNNSWDISGEYLSLGIYVRGIPEALKRVFYPYIDHYPSGV